MSAFKHLKLLYLNTGCSVGVPCTLIFQQFLQEKFAVILFSMMQS